MLNVGPHPTTQVLMADREVLQDQVVETELRNEQLSAENEGLRMELQTLGLEKQKVRHGNGRGSSAYVEDVDFILLLLATRCPPLCSSSSTNITPLMLHRRGGCSASWRATCWRCAASRTRSRPSWTSCRTRVRCSRSRTGSCSRRCKWRREEGSPQTGRVSQRPLIHVLGLCLTPALDPATSYSVQVASQHGAARGDCPNRG